MGANLKNIRWVEQKKIPCYCGGEVLMVLTKDKKLFMGWNYGYYKKPKWQIVNCYPKEVE